VRSNVHNEGRAACGPSLSIVGLGIVAQTAEEVSLAKAALSSPGTMKSELWLRTGNRHYGHAA